MLLEEMTTAEAVAGSALVSDLKQRRHLHPTWPMGLVAGLVAPAGQDGPRCWLDLGVD